MRSCGGIGGFDASMRLISSKLKCRSEYNRCRDRIKAHCLILLGLAFSPSASKKDSNMDHHNN